MGFRGWWTESCVYLILGYRDVGYKVGFGDIIVLIVVVYDACLKRSKAKGVKKK
jgi:hypothetical protein